MAVLVLSWVAVWLLATTAAAASQKAPCRDRWLEPFSSDSIWNTAIGSGAKFKPAGLFAVGDHRGLPPSFHNDQDFLLRGSTSDPETDWINQGDWGSDDHCAVQKGHATACGSADRPLDGCVAKVRLPRSWTSASDCDDPTVPSSCRSAGNQSNNNAMALLLEDNVTLVQMQPAYRCQPYPAPLLARWGNLTDGAPQRFDNVTSILGDGIGGAHGGSGLSSIGGSIRLGELLPDAPPIRHALKIEVSNWWYYGGSQLNPNTPNNGGRNLYVWPATGSNEGWSPSGSGSYLGTNRYVVPGALLAIPGNIASSVNTTTVIGGKIKQAMVDYGAYIVDGTGHGPGGGPHHNSGAICMDALVNAEMRRTYGFSMAYPHGVASRTVNPSGSSIEHELFDDLLRIFQALHAVSNNTPGSIGGGGTPRIPRKSGICGA